MNNNDNESQRRGIVWAVAGSAVTVFALLGPAVAPAAAERVRPEREAVTVVAVDIVESVLDRKLEIAADRVARPSAYGSTWRG